MDLETPAALEPVAVTVKLLLPTSSVVPEITPVEELIEMPGGKPAAVYAGDPPANTVGVNAAIEVFFLPNISVVVSSK